MTGVDHEASGTGTDRLLHMGTDSVVKRAVTSFLDSTAQESSILVLEGEAGIGKTTHLLAIVDEAERRGTRVLLARPTEAESRLAYVALADLVSTVEPEVLDTLPSPQRVALERVLSRVTPDDAPTDPAATAMALLSLARRLGQSAQLLLAVDDLQWVDPSSRQALTSVARRLPAAVSLVVAVRTGDGGEPASGLQPPRPEALRRLAVPPMRREEVEALVSMRLGRTVSRVDMEHVHRMARGNPFFALELARSLDDDQEGRTSRTLPDTLADAVRSRVADASPDVRRALLAVASLAEPTVELVREALDLSTEDIQKVTAEAEGRRLLQVDGPRLRFVHPLLSAGVYADSLPEVRRAMHRRLAECVPNPEERARHLAMGASVPDRATVRALDEAAAGARIRGAPAAAAELLDLAISLGGEDAERTLLLSQHLVDAGDAERARRELAEARRRVGPGTLRARINGALAQVYLDADSFTEAAVLLEASLAEAGSDPALQVQGLTRLSYARLNEGRFEEARQAVEQAVEMSELHQLDHLLALALSLSTLVGFMCGDGFDNRRMDRALSLEDQEAQFSVAFSPGVQAAMLLAWTGRLDEASRRLEVLRRRCRDGGQEHDEIFLDFQAALVAAWRGQVGELTELAVDVRLRADLLRADLSSASACTVGSLAAAITGDVDGTRRLAREGQLLFERCGVKTVARIPPAVLGFLELSRGDPEACLAALAPLLHQVWAIPRTTELLTSSFLPDAIESLIALGRLDEAESLLTMLETNGRRLDRAWMLATGARCRSLLLAARGELPAALGMVNEALAHHDRVPMPLERARTLLVLGQVHRRLRHKDAAAAALATALEAFEDMGARLWAERCRAELARVAPGRGSESLLTSSEQQVAELAAGGMTNREVAAALFISPKTVEANLAKVYRKLGIRSRAELGRLMAQQD